jgi:hypothetical protein
MFATPLKPVPWLHAKVRSLQSMPRFSAEEDLKKGGGGGGAGEEGRMVAGVVGVGGDRVTSRCRKHTR